MRKKKIFATLGIIAILTLILVPTTFANPDVSGAIESTWNATQSQIRSVVDRVIFPILSVILAIAFFVKLGMAYFDYRKHGQFEWTAPAILFACLIFVLTAPNFLWGIIGM
ncbi:MAG: DUF3852 domain-containing protein [Oscillospiraceae bacterium]|nr:DUF3852 domain-containing protein [Oscillospiraceae bacterium]